MRLCAFHCAVGLFYAIAQSTATTTYELEKPSGTNFNGTGWQISRVVINKNGTKKTVCGDSVDNSTLLVFCAMSGYMEYEQLSPDNSMSWSQQLSVGHSAKCGKYDDLSSCTISDISGCTKSLIINCTSHYKTVLEAGVSTNDLLLPVILIPVCLLYVIVLCYLESEDVRKAEAARKHMLKADTVKAFQTASKSNKSKEGTV
ncbi:hypothetical protein ACHWQZ_G010142 [Mnemiopsis leidyi]